MRALPIALLGAAFTISGHVAALGQSAAPQPALSAEQALQLFAEAGFPLVDRAPVNRCARPSNPRVAFVDLNGDGRAEAHIADVDPNCYGKPGAYFAIMAQQADGSWRRLIAEDGIVGFAGTRTQGWHDLTLEAPDSACPGTRRFDGTSYNETSCRFTLPVAAASASTTGVATPAPTAISPEDFSGTRAEQLSQLLRNIVRTTQGREWNAVIAAFPGARWEQQATHAPNWVGSTRTRNGTIPIGGATYHIGISGTAERVNEILLNSPPDDLMEWDTIAAVLPAQGVNGRNIGCHSPTGFGWVRLTVDGHSAILHKSVNYGSAVPSTDIYSFVLDDPFDSRTEAQVAADRSFC